MVLLQQRVFWPKSFVFRRFKRFPLFIYGSFTLMPIPRKRPAAQPLIASFFGAPKPPVSGTIDLTTPEKVRLGRLQSSLARVVSSASGFEEVPSSDTSFTSPEINNFRNPRLTQSFLAKSATIDLSSDKENEEPRSSPVRQKRAAPVDFFGKLKPQKLQRLTSHIVSQPASVASGAVQLSAEQQEVVKYVVSGRENVFFTGSAGTGKSVVLRHLVQQLRRQYGPSKVGVTASTGLAACNIGGQTVHKYLGIGLGTGSPQEIANKIKKNAKLKDKWKNMRVLIIDEISMIDGTLFAKINELAKIVKASQQPFGGIQVVCTGDFFQLPPVSKTNDAKFCFECAAWKQVIKHTIMLRQVFRQKGDNELIDMLNACRRGELTEPLIAKFRALSRTVKYDDGIEPTELYPTREEVKRANWARLAGLPGPLVRFVAKDNVSEPHLRAALGNLMCEELLELKEGAQVMYLKNHPDNTVVNGLIGTVLFFATPLLWQTIDDDTKLRLRDSDVEAVQEMRLLLSLIGCSEWNNDQRLMYEAVVPYGRRSVFMALVAVAAKELRAMVLPVVAFKGNVNTVLQVEKEVFYVDSGRLMAQGHPVDRLEREQLPLLLLWALSIHKAQGQSIDRLRIDLKKIFEKGQVYVALSRATNKEHLEVRNFDPRRITTSDQVKEFYDKL